VCWQSWRNIDFRNRACDHYAHIGYALAYRDQLRCCSPVQLVWMTSAKVRALTCREASWKDSVTQFFHEDGYLSLEAFKPKVRAHTGLCPWRRGLEAVVSSCLPCLLHSLVQPRDSELEGFSDFAFKVDAL
jgi:hypothetical protein